METYNPYKLSLALLSEELKKDDIPLVTDKKIPDVISKPLEGFDADVLKSYLRNVQKKRNVKKRTKKQYSGYEILECLRKSYFLRLGYEQDYKKIGQYPFSTIKATMGNVIEQLVLSMYNQTNGTKFRNSVWLKWDTTKELGLQYPFVGCIDGLSYDEDIILDVKYTDTQDEFHVRQIKLYAMVREAITGKKTFKAGEVIYVNSQLNSITKKRFTIDDETRENDFKKIVTRMKYYDNCLRKNQVPAAEHKNCNFCPYEKLCKEYTNSGMIDQKILDEYKLPESNLNSHTVSNKQEKNGPVVIVDQKNKKQDEIKINNHPKPDNNIKFLI